jgi:hypothetical protein
MFRSYWKATLAAALSLGGLAVWAQTQYSPAPVSSTYGLQMPVGPADTVVRQAPAPASGTVRTVPVAAVPAKPAERIITVQEPGRPPQQCKVVREVRGSDGNNAFEVQALDTGEKMTIVDGGSVLTEPDAYPNARIQGRVSRVLRPNHMVLPDSTIVVDTQPGVAGAPVVVSSGAAPVAEGQVAENSRFPLLRRMFGLDSGTSATSGASTASGTAAASSGGVSSGPGFDRDKYLADLRAKYGQGSGATGPGDTAIAVNKPASTLPTVTPPPPPSSLASKAPAKPAVETAPPSDWRKSWGKNESTQTAKADDKDKDKDKKKEDEERARKKKEEEEAKAKAEVAKAKPEPKKDLPAAPPRADPLWEPERFSKRPEVAAEAPKSASPLLAAESKPKAEVVAVEAPGKASTAKMPLGARSVLAAYEDTTNQVVYLPVPMVTVPPTAHMMPPPHPAPNLPPNVNAAMVNAFTSGSGNAMPAGYENMAANAFPGPAPMMTDPMPMGYPMAMGPYGPMPTGGYAPMGGYGQMGAYGPMGGYGSMPQMPCMPAAAAMPAAAGAYPAAMPVASAGSPMVDPHVGQYLIQTLREALYPSQREFAAEALASMDWRTHPQVFDSLLTAAREDPAPTVRTTCVRCLAGMNLNSTLMAMTLQALKNDGDPRVRNEVEQALAKLPASKTSAGVQPASAVLPGR